MPTPIFVCGAECGLAAVGTAGVGTEHWSSISGTPSVATAPASRGGNAFRFNPSGASSFLTHTYATAIGSPATVVIRCYLYFTTRPGADCVLIHATGFNGAGLYFVASDNSIRAGGSNVSVAASGFAVSTGVWYRIDLKVVQNTTRTVDLQVDGAAQTQYSAASAAASISTVTFGPSQSVTCDFYVDDIIASGTSGDYPIGAGQVAGLYPNGDGTHVYNAAADFGKAGTALTALNATPASETTSWQSLKNPLSLTVDNTKFISDQAGASTEYLEWAFDDLPAVTLVNGLMVVTTNHASAATACVATGRINDNGTTSDIYNLADFSEITIVTAVKTYAIAPSTSAAWTKTLVDGLKFQWGLSTDVNPDPILDGVCFEVDYVPATPYDGLPPFAIIAPSIAAQRASRW